MRILVTGCNGLVGRVSSERLARAGHEVFGVDVSPAASPLATTGGPAPACGARGVHVGDLRNPMEIHRAIDHAGWVPDAIVHLANHRNADAGPAEVVLRENLSMNTSVFMAAKDLGVGRVVFSSSVQAALGGIEGEVRGEGPVLPERLPIDETVMPRPTNAYGLSKLMTERMLDGLATTVGPKGGSSLSAVSLRIPWVLAERQFEWAVTKGRPTPELWGLTEGFAYIHVADLAEAIRLAVESRVVGHEVCWIVASDTRPVEPIAEVVDRAYSSVPGARECIARGGFYDCAKAARVLGWKATRLLGEARARHARGEAFT
jgi:UDP-glucose 4-epimerase